MMRWEDDRPLLERTPSWYRRRALARWIVAIWVAVGFMVLCTVQWAPS